MPAGPYRSRWLINRYAAAAGGEKSSVSSDVDSNAYGTYDVYGSAGFGDAGSYCKHLTDLWTITMRKAVRGKSNAHERCDILSAHVQQRSSMAAR